MEKIKELITNKQWQKALGELNNSLNKNDNPQALLKIHDYLGFVNYQLENYEKAHDHCQKALEIKPDHPYGYKALGNVLAILGKSEAAINAFLHSIHLSPSFFDSYHDLAWLLLRLNRKEEAKKWAQRAYQLDPQRGEKLVRNFYDK